MENKTCIVIFTRDLRVHDNPCLDYAVKNFENIIPVFIHDHKIISRSHQSDNRLSYLKECLHDLDKSLKERGSKLVVLQGDYVETLIEFSKIISPQCVVWARDVSHYAQNRDQQLKEHLEDFHIVAKLFDSHYVVAPESISPSTTKTNQSIGYKVFTPYYKQWSMLPTRDIFEAPRNISTDISAFDKNVSIDELFMIEADLVSPNRQIGGETLIREHLNSWARNSLSKYSDIRNDLFSDSTSKLSSAMHFGTISAVEIITKLRGKPGSEEFIRQICWRDFYMQVLYHHSYSAWSNYNKKEIDWEENEEAFKAWCNGETGYPIVDAAMKQLIQEGFMHNRARMIVASFLTKDLGINWKKGADWFMKWLTDGDIASNNLNWQWVAGTGTDTNPHRIFNPIRQSERFDPEGKYIKKYLPHLSNIDSKDIHFPHHLRERLDTSHLLENYPMPIVDHKVGIDRFKMMLERAKG